MSELVALVRAFVGVTIEVMGDPIIDIYHHGRVDRLSPEAPVPVFIEEFNEWRRGGAANVLENLAQLGCRTFKWFPPAPHTAKHRYLVGAQQLFRIDEDEDHSGQVGLDAIRPAPDAFVISDYGKGWCSPARCRALIERAGEIPVVVDPKGADWDKYSGAALMCPNKREWEEHIYSRAPTRPVFPAVAVKRGAEGIELMRRDAEPNSFPACARHVFDVTGAGDTVTAICAATLAVGGTLEQACELANIAAGVVVGEVGTTAIAAQRLLKELGA